MASTRTESDVLAALSERPRIVFTRCQLIDHVGEPAWLGDDACSTFASRVYYTDRKGFAKALRPTFYTAADAAAAHAEFDTFRDSVWGMKHPHAVATWQAAWERIIPHLAFPRGLRRGLDSRRLGSTLPPLRVGRRRAHVPDETQTERTLQRAPAPMPSARLRPAVTTAVVADQAAGMNAPGGVRAGGSPRP